ncbi:AAA family ATPase, partial [Cutibacterium acnes]
GVGKSSLLKGFQASVTSCGYTIIELKANPQSKFFPYAVAYQLLLEIFAAQGRVGTVESWVTDSLANDSELIKWIGLLNLITPLKLDDFQSPLHLNAAVKAEATASVYKALLRGVAKKAKLLFCIEDVQWFDDLSLNLIADSVFDLPNFKCIYTARVSTENHSIFTGFPAIFTQGNNYHRIELKPLSVPEVRLFLQHSFDVPQVPLSIAETVARISEGNLLLLSSLCQRLLQSGVVCKSEADRTLLIDYP